MSLLYLVSMQDAGVNMDKCIFGLKEKVENFNIKHGSSKKSLEFLFKLLLNDEIKFYYNNYVWNT